MHFFKTTLYHGGWKYDLHKLYLRHMQPLLRQRVDGGTRSDANSKYTRSACAHTHAHTRPLRRQLFTSRWMLVNVPNPLSCPISWKKETLGIRIMNPYLEGIDCTFIVNNLKCLVSDSCAALETKRCWRGHCKQVEETNESLFCNEISLVGNRRPVTNKWGSRYLTKVLFTRFLLPFHSFHSSPRAVLKDKLRHVKKRKSVFEQKSIGILLCQTGNG